ncbi:hypothetical protein SAMN05660662_3859 [Blastococcus aurantiacus]|uniref:DUF5667 domain-containing protein n=1 Tax=Blastococcus aurantiacus TaxID=1550231 RepID=A0A1G7Q1B7_9ACTN|nr:DUF5667 domain-containing protein [Blastococcus aurantiacus]SDF92285.1 hypothetical protein SAMN05660662_3859 [Blastococcus aurantiacus]
MTTHESNAAPSRRAARRGDEQDARVVMMLQELAPHLEVEPDPEYRRAARQRLVAMAAVRTPEPVRPSPLRRLLAARAVDAPAGRWHTRVTAGLAGAALTVTSLATLVALSTGARPGDVLYGVKRGTEQTQLALAGDSRGQALLDLARTRLEELDDVDGDAGLVRSTLATMDDQTTEGASWYLSQALDTSDAAPLDRLSGWTSEQSAQLQAVGVEVPAGAADDVAASQGLLDAITGRVASLRVALDCPEGPALTGRDRLGPVPGECRPEVTAPQGPPVSTVPSVPVPGAPAPNDPAPGGTPPQAGPSTTPLEPTTPAGPSAVQPGPVNPQLPGPSAAPPTGPDEVVPLPGLLPELPVPTLPPRTTSPAAPSASPSPSPVLQVPTDLLPCVDIPVLLRAGNC